MSTNILVVPTITPLLTANVGTKLLISSYLNNVFIPTCETLTEGGNDNTGLKGVAKFNGLRSEKYSTQYFHTNPNSFAKIECKRQLSSN